MSALLLDTHAFIWFVESDENLPTVVKSRIEIADTVYLSIASLWEIAIKTSLGKLVLQREYESIEVGLDSAGITLLPISFADTVHLLKLPFHHRDPFDRMLVAQAITHSLSLVSRDAVLDAYPIQRLWE